MQIAVIFNIDDKNFTGDIKRLSVSYEKVVFICDERNFDLKEVSDLGPKANCVLYQTSIKRIGSYKNITANIESVINVNSFYDSIAGIIFIANKLKSSCYHCFEHYLSNFLTNNYLPDFKKLEEENPLEECGSSSVPGTSPNTSQIAIYGASVILDFLSNGYSKNSEGNNINLFIYSNNEIQQESRVYFANSPKVEKFSSPSYNKCQVCSHDKYEVSEEIEMNYIKNMETIEN